MGNANSLSRAVSMCQIAVHLLDTNLQANNCILLKLQKSKHLVQHMLSASLGNCSDGFSYCLVTQAGKLDMLYTIFRAPERCPRHLRYILCLQRALVYLNSVHLHVHSSSEIVLGGEISNWKKKLFAGRESYKAGFFFLKPVVWLLLLCVGLGLLFYLHMYLLWG